MARAAGVPLLLAAAAAAAQGRAPARPAVDAGPRIITARQATLERNPALRALIDDVHRDADAIVVLTGARPSLNMARRQELRALLDALGDLARERRIVVGDGGTAAGVSGIAGEVRQASGHAFRLVGVAPAREIAPAGSAAVDPRHSHVIAVEDPALPAGDPAWGSETATMYWLFNRFSEGRNSVAIVAGGDAGALQEIAHNVEFGRPTILVEGSGGAADGMVALVRSTTPSESQAYLLLQRARAARLNRRPDLFRIVAVDAGAPALLAALRKELGPVLPRMP